MDKFNRIPINASDQYINALRAYVRLEGKSFGEFTRKAIDAYVQNNLAPFIAIYAANDTSACHHEE